jgi:hypothetical protein
VVTFHICNATPRYANVWKPCLHIPWARSGVSNYIANATMPRCWLRLPAFRRMISWPLWKEGRGKSAYIEEQVRLCVSVCSLRETYIIHIPWEKSVSSVDKKGIREYSCYLWTVYSHHVEWDNMHTFLSGWESHLRTFPISIVLHYVYHSYADSNPLIDIVADIHNA